MSKNLPVSAAQTRMAQHLSSSTSFSLHNGSFNCFPLRKYGAEHLSTQSILPDLHVHIESQPLSNFSPSSYVRPPFSHLPIVQKNKCTRTENKTYEIFALT